MCDCIQIAEKNMKEHLSKDHGNIGFLIISATWSETRKVLMEANFSYELTRKNGKVVEKEKKVVITANYCPFCGEKYPE